jgi:hypothetical protein
VFEKINGLPAHVLLIHAVIVLVPLAALMLVAGALWPAARARLGFLTPAVALVALVLVPVTMKAGQWLRDHLGFTNAAVRRHANLGGTLLPWVVGLFVMATVVWVLSRRYELTWRSSPASVEPPVEGSGGGGTATMTKPATAKQALPVWVNAVIAVLALVVAVGSVVQLYRIGDSGAHAVWDGSAATR